MSSYVHFTDEQKARANAVDLAELLQRQGEKLIRSGNEWRWEKYDSITIRGNSWFRHSRKTGGYAIDFVQEFFGMSFPQAVTFLLNGENGVERKIYTEPAAKQKQEFILPEVNSDMRRVYAYLMKQRYICRDVISHFAKSKNIYEDNKYHNAVFVGCDEHGIPRHAHKKGTASGDGFCGNVTGSDPRYSFRHVGVGSALFVFEAPVDLLSFLTLYQRNWQSQSYVSLCGISEHAMLYVLESNPHIKKVCLCLDSDKAGVEASQRLNKILNQRGYTDVCICRPKFKDWNDDLKSLNGIAPTSASEKSVHTKIETDCSDEQSEMAMAL